MSDNKTSWSDRDRIVYILTAMEYSSFTIEYAKAPRPPGRSVSSCNNQIWLLKKQLKPEMDTLRAGHAIPDDSPGKKKAPTMPRKRKAKSDAVVEDASGGGDGHGEGEKAVKRRKKKVDAGRAA